MADRIGADSHGLRTADVAGVPCAVTTFDAAVDWVLARASAREAVGVRLVNAYSIVSAHRDERYLRLMREKGISLPDGAPVVAALRLLSGRSEAGRVRGPSFFQAVLARSERMSLSHYFLGTTDETLHALVDATRARWPSLTVAGTHAPPFGPVDQALIDDARAAIQSTRADVVWVALGTPKQDFIAEQLAEVLGVPCIAVGAAFDFLAGTKREAPRIVQRLGVEWIHRLLSEPRRLWRRYLIGNVEFLLLLLRHPPKRHG